jgi:hypothetical protein
MKMVRNYRLIFAGRLILGLAGCMDPVQPESGPGKNGASPGSVPEGMGLAYIRLSAGNRGRGTGAERRYGRPYRGAGYGGLLFYPGLYRAGRDRGA